LKLIFSSLFRMALPSALILAAVAVVNSFITATVIISADKTSWNRLTVALAVAYLAYLEVLAAIDFSPNLLYNGTVAAWTFVKALHLINLVWINAIDQRDLKTMAEDTKGSTTLQQLLSVLVLTFNIRGIGTPWQTKNLPSWSAFYTDGKPTTRTAFLCRQLALVAWQYLALDFLFFLPTLQSPEELDNMYGKGLEFQYLGLTTKQWVGRVSGATLTWIAGRIMIQWWHGTLSLLFVGSGLSRPEEWPPLFGSIWQSYSLRNFWG
jgi:hypothetical protein